MGISEDYRAPTRLTEDDIRSKLVQAGSYDYPALDQVTLVTHLTRPAREASVLIPLYQEAGEWHVIYIRRTETVGNHKGQVAFPGGGAEPEDASSEATALREAWEEIGLPPEEVRMLGQLKPINTHTGFHITPHVGVIPWPYPIRISDGEVSRVFSIPLAWLAQPQNHYVGDFTSLPDRQQRRVIYFLPYHGETLWGISAIITVAFLAVLGL